MTGKNSTYTYFCLMTVVLACAASIPAHSQTSDSLGHLVAGASQRSVLLKKTDRVLNGKVRSLGKYIEIEVADQSRVSILQEQIAFIGENLEAVYEFKKRSISRWAVGDHFQLTRWCIQNGMLNHAVEHYLEVNRQAAQNDSVKRLGSELEQKILSDEKFRQFIGLAPNNPETAPVSVASPKPISAVAQASFSSIEVNSSEISRRFTDRVQPILINRCSQAACHGVSSSNAWRVIEPSGKSYARISSENLRQVLAQLEPDQNNVPKLIKYATQAHGLQREPGLTAAEVGLLDELKRWIKFVENPVVPAVATQNLNPQSASGARLVGASQALQPNALNALMPVAPGAAQLRSVPKATDPNEFPASEARPSMSEIDALEAQLNRILSTQPEGGGASTGDPFDPAEFNRQAGHAKRP